LTETSGRFLKRPLSLNNTIFNVDIVKIRYIYTFDLVKNILKEEKGERHEKA